MTQENWKSELVHAPGDFIRGARVLHQQRRFTRRFGGEILTSTVVADLLAGGLDVLRPDWVTDFVRNFSSYEGAKSAGLSDAMLFLLFTTAIGVGNGLTNGARVVRQVGQGVRLNNMQIS